LDGDIIDAIKKRSENWDLNKFEWSHEPMFLIADLNKVADNDDERNEQIRNLDWVRNKFLSKYDIKGTISNYDLINDEGSKPCSVLGIFIDRQFYPIASLETFDKIKKILDENE